MPDTHDPLSYLRSEIAAFDAGLRPNWEPWQREHYEEVVLAENVVRAVGARCRHRDCQIEDQ